MRITRLLQRNLKTFGPLSVLFLIAACTTSGGNVFSDAAPKPAEQSTEQAVEQTAQVRPGTNPHATTRQINTRNSLSDYCPSLRIRAGTESYRIYKGEDRENPDNVRYQATLTKVARECKYVGQDLEITIGARGRIIAGPAGKSGDIRMPIRIAIQEGSCSRHFELYQQAGTVPAGTQTGTFQFVGDKIIIPAPRSLNVKMFIGFDEGPYGKPSTKSCV